MRVLRRLAVTHAIARRMAGAGHSHPTRGMRHGHQVAPQECRDGNVRCEDTAARTPCGREWALPDYRADRLKAVGATDSGSRQAAHTRARWFSDGVTCCSEGKGAGDPRLGRATCGGLLPPCSVLLRLQYEVRTLAFLPHPCPWRRRCAPRCEDIRALHLMDQWGMAIINYGHHDQQDDVCSGCRVRTRARRLGSSLAGFEVRGVAAGHPE